MTTLKSMRFIITLSVLAFLLNLTISQKVCKRFICNDKYHQPETQINDTFCLNEQTTAKDLYKVFVYPDMCLSIFHIFA